MDESATSNFVFLLYGVVYLERFGATSQCGDCWQAPQNTAAAVYTVQHFDASTVQYSAHVLSTPPVSHYTWKLGRAPVVLKPKLEQINRKLFRWRF